VRFILTAVFVAALAAVPVQSKAAPRSIDDCEKVQAADAYNQCLALFGPLARGHGAAGDGQDADTRDAEAATGNAHAEVATAGDAYHGRPHTSRHRWPRLSWARHGHWHRTGAAGHRRHGRTTSVAFNIVPGHTRLR
jgi:hypothetical protein